MYSFAISKDLLKTCEQTTVKNENDSCFLIHRRNQKLANLEETWICKFTTSFESPSLLNFNCCCLRILRFLLLYNVFLQDLADHGPPLLFILCSTKQYLSFYYHFLFMFCYALGILVVVFPGFY